MRLHLALLLAAPSFAQTTWFVDVAGTPPGSGTANDPYTSLQYGLDQPTTLDGDTLLVATGIYPEQIDFQGKAVRIVGAVPRPTIDGGGGGPVVTLQSGEGPDSVLEGFRVLGGDAVAGGGILVSGAAPTLVDLVVRGNNAQQGGGLAALAGAAPILLDCRFVGNSAWEGAGLWVAGPVVMDGGTIEDNVADHPNTQGYGGGVNVGAGSFAASGVLFANNSAFPFGGGGAIAGGPIDVVDSVFRNNHPGSFFGVGNGGAILTLPSSTVKRSTFEDNGGIGSDWFDGTFRGGAAVGGVYEECTFRGNSAQFGGGLADATAIDCWFERNVGCADGSGFGGAVHNCTVQGSTLIANWACGDGGGANASSVIDCEVLHNVAYATTGSGGQGGGVANGTAIESTIRGNLALPDSSSPASLGGGLFKTSIDRCVVVDNAADLGGGAAFVTSSWGVQSSSFAGNVAFQAGGGIWAGTFGVVGNSALWGNAPDAFVDASGSASVTWSIVEGGASGTGNLAVDPTWFGPAGSDLHLLAGSPAIDAGDPNAPPDPDGSRLDIGAIPYDAAWVGGAYAYCSTDATWPGDCVPRVSAGGTPSLGGPDDFVVAAQGVPPGVFGLLFHGTAPTLAFTTYGSLCVAPPYVRFAPQLSKPGSDACAGTFRQKLSQAYLAGLGLAPGDLLYLQYWFRLPQGAGAAFTDAIEARILP